MPPLLAPSARSALWVVPRAARSQSQPLLLPEFGKQQSDGQRDTYFRAAYQAVEGSLRSGGGGPLKGALFWQVRSQQGRATAAAAAAAPPLPSRREERPQRRHQSCASASQRGGKQDRARLPPFALRAHSSTLTARLPAWAREAAPASAAAVCLLGRACGAPTHATSPRCLLLHTCITLPTQRNNHMCAHTGKFGIYANSSTFQLVKANAASVRQLSDRGAAACSPAAPPLALPTCPQG